MDIRHYCVTDGQKFKLKHFATAPPEDSNEKKELKEQLTADIKEIRTLQSLLYADERHSVLMLFQAMDAAGKDGAIKHVMSGINPQGCHVVGFKAPTSREYAFPFLWRHIMAMPERGRIGIHNRSHYEFVLACKVNPEFVLKERLPGIRAVEDLTPAFWKQRYRQIADFEAMLAETGTVQLKFFLHLSREEQRSRLLKRINTPAKNWKFDASDMKARAQWDAYMDAYEEAIRRTAAPHAPWYVIPADDKWFARALIARILKETLQGLDMHYPRLHPDALHRLEQARLELMS